MVYSEDRSTQKDTSSRAVTSSLSDLIARIEKATGPDKSLDAEINLEVFTQIALPDAPPYTSSIDAAMTLVPKGWCCGFEHGGRFDRNPNAVAWCWPFNSDFEPDWRNGDEGYRSAPDGHQGVGTVAIALCIAALKARSQP